MGRLSAEWILRAHAGRPLGVIHRNSESWEPGHASFLQTLSRAGVQPVIDVPTYQDQGSYTQQILALQESGAQVVFLWDDPTLAAVEIIKQAKAQGYSPVWVIGPPNINVIVNTLGEDALHPPVEALTYVLPYSPGVSGGPYARYGAEIRRFERIYQQYRPGRTPNDFAWAFWIGWQAVARGFLLCGSDCSRNRLLSLRGWSIDPYCPVDFSGGDHFGAHTLTVARAYRLHGHAAWRAVPGTFCRDHF
jgi:hypothetical protein